MLKFSKMHGLGNDFMVIDGVNQNISLSPRQLSALADRHTGIGFDQCLIIEPAKQPNADFYYRIFNADGSEVGQCGNGARCLALFIKEKKLSAKENYLVHTFSSTLQLTPIGPNQVSVEFDEPNFTPKEIPLNAPNDADFYTFELNGTDYYLHCASVGNPHGILIVDELNDSLINELGPKLSAHPKFPESANISFVKIVDKQHIMLRVYERGAGETKACGSAALASAACVRLFHHGAEKITATLPGGELHIQWKGLGHKITFSGPATTVFEGMVELP